MLDKFLLPDQSEEERVLYLADTSDEVVEQTYHIRLDAAEITAKRAEFTRQHLRLRQLQQEKKDYLDTLKDQMKPIQETTNELADELNTGYTRKHGRLYKIIDHESKTVGYYSPSGELIETLTRPANREELSQMTIAHSIRMTGTNDR